MDVKKAFEAYPTLYIAPLMVAINFLFFLLSKIRAGLSSLLPEHKHTKSKKKGKQPPQIEKLFFPDDNADALCDQKGGICHESGPP